MKTGDIEIVERPDMVRGGPRHGHSETDALIDTATSGMAVRLNGADVTTLRSRVTARAKRHGYKAHVYAEAGGAGVIAWFTKD